jgi:hypothetical protein
MGIINWIILGLIAGFIGSKIVDNRAKVFGSIPRSEFSALLLAVSCLTWSNGDHRPEHLEQVRGDRLHGRGARGLQCADGSPPSLVSRRRS